MQHGVLPSVFDGLVSVCELLWCEPLRSGLVWTPRTLFLKKKENTDTMYHSQSMMVLLV